MKKKMILEKSIEELGLNTKMTSILVENDINTIEDIWVLKRKDLREFSLSDSDITQIVIKLQLFGLDLNKKVY